LERGAFKAYLDDLVDFVKAAGSVEGLFNSKGLMPTASSEEDGDRVLPYGQVRNMILHRPAGWVSLRCLAKGDCREE